MKQDARVVVIGGGIIGCSIAYHLAKYGCEDVVLVEKGELTSGTTFHSVGLVTQFRTSPVSMQLMNYSIQLFNEFKAELGEELGWMQVGSRSRRGQHEAPPPEPPGLVSHALQSGEYRFAHRFRSENCSACGMDD